MELKTNLDYYKIFSIVAKSKSMKEAAEILYVSQPAITKTIKNLEAQLGGTLFIRSNKGLILTKEGEELLNKVNNALTIIQDAETCFRNSYKLNIGEIRIGISTVLTKILLIDKISKFKELYPNIKITIVNGITPTLLNELYLGNLDIVIFNDKMITSEDIEIEKLTELEYGFVYNPKFFDVKSIEDISKYPIIMQKEPSFTRKYLDDYFNKNNITIRDKVEVVSQEIVKELTKAGLGIGFIYLNMKEKGMKTIKTERLITNINIAKNNLEQTRAVKEFIRVLKSN